MNAAISLMKEYLDKALCYNEEYIVDFAITDDFVKCFGEIDYKGKAVKVANADQILDNFILADDGFTLIDYEWTFFFPIPIDYLKFRSVYYFWVKNNSILSRAYTEEEYLSEFGYNEVDINLWKAAEERFQEYVFGAAHVYMYANNYEGKINDVRTFLNNVPDIGSQFHEARRGIEILEDIVKNHKQTIQEQSDKLASLLNVRTYISYKKNDVKRKYFSK